MYGSPWLRSHYHSLNTGRRVYLHFLKYFIFLSSPFPETALTFAVTFFTSYIANTSSFCCYFLCDFAFFFPAVFFILFSYFALLCSPIHISCCSDDPVALSGIIFWPLTFPLQAPLWAVMLLDPEHRDIKVSHKWDQCTQGSFACETLESSAIPQLDACAAGLLQR